MLIPPDPIQKGITSVNLCTRIPDLILFRLTLVTCQFLSHTVGREWNYEFLTLFLPPTFPLPLPVFSLAVYRCLFTCAPLDPSYPSITLLLLGNLYSLLEAHGTKVTIPGMIQGEDWPSPGLYLIPQMLGIRQKRLRKNKIRVKAKTIKDISLLFFFFSTRPQNI